MAAPQLTGEQKSNKNIDKSPTSHHGEEYYDWEENPRFDQAPYIVLEGSVLGRLSSSQ